MQLIYEDKQKRIIKDKEAIAFSSFSSYHLIEITSRAKSEKQLGKEATDDEELTTVIDDKSYPKLGTKEAVRGSSAAFNGGTLHDHLAKTVYLLTFLKGKNHAITLKTDYPSQTATFEHLHIYTLNPGQRLNLEPKLQAEDGDRRPWIAFTLDTIPLRSFATTITYSRRKRDSDDVKIMIDGKTYHTVILKPFQYEPFNDQRSKAFKKITNPSLNNPIENEAWHESYEAAAIVIAGREMDPTKGANHFYAKNAQNVPNLADEDEFTVEIGNTRFYKL